MESWGEVPKSLDARYESLTPGEQQILRLLVEGLPANEIAEKLFIRPKTETPAS